MEGTIRIGKTASDWPRGERADIPLHAIAGDCIAPTGETASAVNLAIPTVPAGAFVMLWQPNDGAKFYAISAECV